MPTNHWLVKACKRLKPGRDPPIIGLVISYVNRPGRLPYIKVVEQPLTYLLRPGQEIEEEPVLNPAKWRRYGQYVKTSAIKRVNFKVEQEIDSDHEILPEAARCLEAFFMELKEHESIVYISFDMRIVTAIPQMDLRYFFLNSDSALEVRLSSRNPVSLAQSTHVSASFKDVPLEKLQIGSMNFIRNGSFEQILVAAKMVNHFVLKCSEDYQFTALAEILQDPTTTMQELCISAREHSPDLDVDMAENKILTSLAQNSELKKLTVHGIFGRDEAIDSFASLLCNTTSLQGICNSNHTLQTFSLPCCSVKIFFSYCPEYLEMNKNLDKRRAVQLKVMHCYSSKLVDASPLESVPLTVLPQVLSIDAPNKHYALFNILRSLPCLTDVSSRDKAKSDGDTSTGRANIKRQRLDK